jgi:hypothetical protein
MENQDDIQKMIDLLAERGIDSPEKLRELFEPHFFVIIPIDVLERKDLIPNGKLLYGEISALTRRRGYCNATNRHLSERLSVDERTIRRLLVELVRKNLISIDPGRSPAGTYRKIYLNWRPDTDVQRGGQKCPPPMTPASAPGAQECPPKREIDNKKSDKEILLSGFEKFWKAYPNKKAKKKALERWMRMEPSPELTERIIRAVDAAKQTRQWKKDGGDFIPHPTTYLNQERWEDELKADSPKTGGGKFESVKSTKV